MVRLTPEDRREALIAATLPLLRERGVHVSTRQIAEAAGVAEGTIFRVFPDKAALICATLERASDPAPIVESLRHLPDALDVRAKLAMAARIVSRRLGENLSLIFAERSSGLVTASLHRGSPDNLEPIVKALAWLLEPHRDHLLHSTETIARMLLALIMIEPRVPLKDVVAVLLDGALRPERKTEPACS